MNKHIEAIKWAEQKLSSLIEAKAQIARKERTASPNEMSSHNRNAMLILEGQRLAICQVLNLLNE